MSPIPGVSFSANRPNFEKISSGESHVGPKDLIHQQTLQCATLKAECCAQDSSGFGPRFQKERLRST